MPGRLEQQLTEGVGLTRQLVAQARAVDLYSFPHWYATYTCSRCEKQVAKVLEDRGIECFLPLFQTVRYRKSGNRRVALPLFPGYVFVHIALCDRIRVLEIPRVVHLVSFNGEPTPISSAEIVAIRDALACGRVAQPYPFLKMGQKALIKSGPLRGLHGRVLRSNNRLRVVLSVDLLHRSFAVDIAASDLASFVPDSLAKDLPVAA
ncbi:MAG: hypothetical protein LAO24_15820 [Acidobacteriia bacterium]|nr:hypothetical protein [Terriglobia bacterium]